VNWNKQTDQLNKNFGLSQQLSMCLFTSWPSNRLADTPSWTTSDSYSRRARFEIWLETSCADWNFACGFGHCYKLQGRCLISHLWISSLSRHTETYFIRFGCIFV